ncbi:MAG: hypothetical protein RSC76_01235, partial [Oscillospiraceae bacterium]
MKTELKTAFAPIQADEKLKNDTLLFLKEKIAKTETRTQKPTYWRYAISTLACCMLLVAGVVLWNVYFTVNSYISIDINPSIELGLNCFNRVVSTKGYNDDGKQILTGIDVSNKSYEDAVQTLIDNAELQEYIQEDSLMVVTVVSDREEELLDNLEKCTRKTETDFVSCPKEDVEVAHHEELSVGKYRVFQEILALDPTFTLEECKTMNMRELKNRLEAVGGTPKEQSQNHESGQGNCQGNGEVREETETTPSGNQCKGKDSGAGEGKGHGNGGGKMGQGKRWGADDQ